MKFNIYLVISLSNVYLTSKRISTGELGNYQSKRQTDSYQWGSLDRNTSRRKNAAIAYSEAEPDIFSDNHDDDNNADDGKDINAEMEDDSVLF